VVDQLVAKLTPLLVIEVKSH